MDFITDLVAKVGLALITMIVLWIFTHKSDGVWEVRVSYLRGSVDREQKYHRVVFPYVLEDGFEVSPSGIVMGAFRIEPGWPLARPLGWLGKKHGLGLWRNEWGWWGFWIAHRQPDPEPQHGAAVV